MATYYDPSIGIARRRAAQEAAAAEAARWDEPLTRQERAFVAVIKSDLDAGRKVRGCRAAFTVLIDQGISKRDKRSLAQYGPGKRYARLRNKVIEEWEDWASRQPQAPARVV